MISGPFRGSEAIARGVLTRGQLRSARYRRILPDIYVHADDRIDLRLRSRAAFLMVARRGGVLAGYSAAELLGAHCAPANAPAEVLVGYDVRAHPGLLVHRGSPGPGDVCGAGGCRVTSPERTAWDLARRLDLVEAVVAVDALAGRFAPRDLLARRARTPGARGCRCLDKVVELADPRSESPMETRLRLLLVLAGLPVPEVQFPVRNAAGVVLARFDLAYPEAMLAIEYDGELHLSPNGRVRDRERDVDTALRGWHTLRFGKRDVLAAPQRTVRVVAQVRAQRLAAEFDSRARNS
ncbi:endonuclease domain-containing protein [Pseudonocardia hispaniensis]|uniref:Endonuclease domain-containing protein n=1 Tax=Pseudonocardia hispaniensis TaxID=904933 RepID=A0ABW1IWY4_9PSEU